MVISFSSMPSASSIFSTYASISAFIMLVQTILNQFIPRQIQNHIMNIIHHYFKTKPNKSTIIIEERAGMSTNELFNAAETYLCTKIRPNIERLKISKRHKDTGLTIKFAQCEKIADTFEDVNLEWRFMFEERKKTSKRIDEDTDDIVLDSEKRYFELCFEKNCKEKVLDSYIPFMIERAQTIKAEKKVVKLHTLACASNYGGSVVWDSINLEHPSTFQTLAMEAKKKKGIIDDLDRFVRRKDFYRKVGRAWKRGYLLYGPPGTGKSSLIAAMANYLKFDIYDLELTNVRRDSDLRKLLLRTANRSILVIEDIDCSVDLPDRRKSSKTGKEFSDGPGHCHHPRDQQFTLSGLLNFIDGLWSSCGDERIIIFTTNNKEKLDPALLRPGRMDMHIHMSYLTVEGFKLLASTYLNITGHHRCFGEIEELIEGMEVSPAEVAEELMQSDDADTSLEGLVDFLKCKKSLVESNSLKGKGIDSEDLDGGGKGKGVVGCDESDVEV
ncbi:hypothetical protein RD792_008678 [Penstemon davidsonii]|uniref:AAA+ ATPase domain-containing protein n=1 Tax=Penstemon davidsonii TaxID=160366 RepID=A0ABR0D9S6_9LAMI|nr:hypothetical protein RD792_008678 [Penstemon davidsonii]